MARRSLCLLCLAILAAVAALAGCGGSGAGSGVPVGPSNAVTYTPVTSSDGNATLYVPTPGSFPPSAATVVPATLGVANPNTIPGTFYSFAGNETVIDPSLPAFPITIKYSVGSLPQGVSPSELAIAKYLPSPTEPYDAYSYIRSSVDTSNDTVSANVNDTGVYGIIVAPPFAGTYTGAYTGDGSGSVSIQVSAAGEVSAIFTPTGGNSSYGAGTVSYAGAARFRSINNPSGTMVFTGTLYKQGNTVTGAGTWNDNDANTGTWTIP